MPEENKIPEAEMRPAAAVKVTWKIIFLFFHDHCKKGNKMVITSLTSEVFVWIFNYVS